MFQKLERRIFDHQYRLFLTEDFLNITNISKVLILEPTIILVAIGSIQIEIRGENLVLKQMMDDEILITGTVLQIVKKVYE
ncbi:MAG: hypothetical protein DBY23_00150 [Bacillota bacterium]|nr:MAG: hypothetical protein DBY23_00150 [Bacillota bacterium]